MVFNTIKEHFRRRKSDARPTRELAIASILTTNSTPTRVNTLVSRTDPLGLSLIVDPQSAVVDIIFVHGLGGTSRGTWSKDKNPELFWPEKWLPEDLPRARIHSYGYNSNFASTKSSIYSILDFSKELLFAVQYSPCNLGQYPIIFVAHSMGGLLVKKAYTLAKQDPQYQSIFPKLFGTVFLATPHRGSNFAQTLQNMLRVSPNHSAKGYLDDLARNSVALQGINEDFRHVANDYRLVSFYESLRTRIGPTTILVVEKDSATLGYGGEVSAALNADHHTVCKYSGPDDPNYVSVRNVLMRLVRDCQEQVSHFKTEHHRDQMEIIFKLFAYRDSSEDELVTNQQLRFEGSCEWITRKEYFRDWLDNSATDTQLLWLTGIPAAGKSVLSAYVIEYLQGQDKSCQYYFFRMGESAMHTSGSFLKSLALQLAEGHESVRNSLVTLYQDGIRLGTAEARMIWQKAFVATIFRIQFPQPLYWVIDALDEAESSSPIIQMFGSIQSASSHLRIFVTSRHTDPLASAFRRLQTSIPVVVRSINIEDTLPDIRSYVANAVDDLLGNEETKQKVIAKVLERSAGCFLWVRLAIEEVRDMGHTQAGIEAALEDVPAEMDKVYQRAFDTISRLHPQNQTLAKAIIRWAICSVRPLTLEELDCALLPSFGQMLDIERTITRTCAHLLAVDHKRRVLPVHKTVRDFLLKSTHSEFGIVMLRDHEVLARACLDFLNDDSTHPGFQPSQILDLRHWHKNSFMSYATSSWSDHLGLATADSELLLDSLVLFLQNSVLAWIALISSSQNLHTLTRTAQNMKAFLERRAKLPKPTNFLRKSDSVFVELWATDLIRLVTKFGNQLLEAPTAIFKLLPPFCPKQTIIYRKFGASNKNLSVLGLSALAWNDCLARMPMGELVTAIASGDVYFAVALASGTIIILNTETCQECRRLEHSEIISSLQFNSTSDKLVSGGATRVKVWDVNLGRQTHSFDPGHKVISVAFSIRGALVFSACSNNTVKTWDLVNDCEIDHFRWTVEVAGEETPGRYHGFPVALALHAEYGRVAVSYRGFPVSLWEIESQRFLGRVVRKTQSGRGNTVTQDTAFCLDFNRVTGHLVLGYSDGTMLKWDPATDEQDECDADTQTISCSDDGAIIGTGDSDGNIKLWSFATLELIYHICTYDNPIELISFSPDGLRVYDVRGSNCSAWEPDVLVRATKSDDDQSTFSTRFAEITGVTPPTKLPLRSLICDARGEFCAYGRDDGSIYLASATSGNEVQKLYSHATTVSIVAHIWSTSGDLMATADNSRRFILRRLANDGGAVTRIGNILIDSRANSSVRQLLFSSDEQMLFVFTLSNCEVWTTKGDRLRSVTFNAEIHGEWSNIPMDSSQLLCLKDDQASIFSSETLKMIQLSPSVFDLKRSQDSVGRLLLAPGAEHHGLHVTKIIPYSAGTLFVIEVSPRVYAPGSVSIMLWDSACIMEPPRRIIQNTEALIGIYERKVVFLDSHLWVCSWDLNNRSKVEDFSFKRHFFLPHDWMDGREAQQCTLTPQGNVVFATEGGLAVISGGLMLTLTSQIIQPREIGAREVRLRPGINTMPLVTVSSH